MRFVHRLERLVHRFGIPPGALAVAAGLAVSAGCSYVFLIAAARGLGADKYSSVAALWTLAFVATGGLYLPVEQELAREYALRRAQGLGGSGLFWRALVVAAAMAGVVLLGAICAYRYVVEDLFDGSAALIVAFGALLFGYATLHVVRGSVAGLGRFGTYGLALSAEGAVRGGGAVAVLAIGLDVPWAFGVVLAVAPWLAASVGARERTDIFLPGIGVSWSKLVRPILYLLVAAVMSSLLLNVGPLIVKVLASDAQSSEAGRFLNGVAIARVPLFFFAAVQAVILPRFSSLVGSGQFDELRSMLRKLVLLVVVVSLTATVAVTVVGPGALRLLFGEDFTLGRRDLGLISVASGFFMFAQVCSQPLIALRGHLESAVAWTTGVIAFAAATALLHGLLLRVELGLVVGCAAASGVTWCALARRLRESRRPADAGVPYMQAL